MELNTHLLLQQMEIYTHGVLVSKASSVKEILKTGSNHAWFKMWAPVFMSLAKRMKSLKQEKDPNQKKEVKQPETDLLKPKVFTKQFQDLKTFLTQLKSQASQWICKVCL